MPAASKKRKLELVAPGSARAEDAASGAPSPAATAAAEQTWLRPLFEAVSDGLLVVDAQGKIAAMNLAAEELTGYLRTELLARPVWDLTPAAETPRHRPFAAGVFGGEGTFEDIVLRMKDGGPRIVDVQFRRVADGTRAYVLKDVTLRKQMERDLIAKHQELRQAYVELEKKASELKSTQETLVQAGKLAALGELAAGIAHELNQPLMAIRGYAQELQHSVGETLAAHERFPEWSLGLKEVVSGADKMARIIQHLRTFTRKSTEDFDWIAVSDPIEEALKMLDRQLRSRGIAVERDFAEDTKIYANALTLEQVFINLASNARDAIEATARADGKISVAVRRRGELVEVRFADNGCGMDERTARKAFNPFFTTKEVGKGMGLGLSLSHGMIAKLNGSLRIESELGKGTTFVIQLPVDFRQMG